MPYIGRNHIAGDHTSNFKVLDDISSYTATFNGSSALIISTTDNTIRVPEHRFVQGQRVTYSNGGGGNIGGLTNGTAYFVTFDTANTFKLATSLANANNNTNINLSSVGTGSAHTLTAAFDGVNTTFKITHGGGSSADIVNSAQLQIAINNVIQKANLDSSYTEGFFVVDSRKIQFKTAPNSDDIFWGNIIANTIETFDIADLKVDNFTGDGTTTQFTLSRPVPNNESLMVTIDGVLQHPSDKDTTRAYRVLSESVIEFSSPPPNHSDVQVRHLGFAGAATGEVSGFYGRTGNVVLGASDHITTGDITPRNINASGIVTASSFVGNLTGNVTGNVSGNLTVGGVLTYEDVTNVDSIGIITARSDIHVGAGVSAVGVGTFGSLDIGGDIDVDGHTNLDNLSIAGVSTFTGAVNTTNVVIGDFLNVGSNIKLGNAGVVTATSYRGDGSQLTGIVAGLSTISGVVNVANDLNVDGHTNLDNVSIAGVTTFSEGLHVPVSKFVELKNSSGATRFYFRHHTDNRTSFYHDGTGRLEFLNSQNGADIQFRVRYGISNTRGLDIHGTTGNILPYGDSLQDIGENTIRWRNGYFDTLYGDGSNLTGISGVTINNNADNRVITGSGTAATLNGESTLTFDGTKLESPRIDSKGLIHLEYSSSTDTNYMMTMNNNNGIMHIFRGDGLFIGNNMNTSNQGTGPNNKAIELKTNGDVRITGNFNCLSDNRGIYFGGSNQLRILGLDNGDSIIDAVSGSCKIQDNGSGCITFGAGTVDVKQKLKVDYAVSGSDYCAYIRNQNANSYGLQIQQPNPVNVGYPLLAVGNAAGGNHFRVDTGGLVYANSGTGTEKPAYFVRAWVQGNSGTTNGSGGLSSMSRVSTGNYRLNFTTTMPDDNYATGCLANNNYDDTSWHGNTDTTGVNVYFYTGSSYVDPSEWSAWVIR